jgi:hypothetical protein
LARALEPRSPEREIEAKLDPPVESEVDRRVEELEREIEILRAEVNTARQVGGQYFALIEGIIEEREVWKRMWRSDASGHLTAQAMLEDTLVTGRQMFNRVITELNERRKSDGLPPLDWRLEPMAPPVGVAAETKARIAAQEAAAPPGVDGVAERDRIAGVVVAAQGERVSVLQAAPETLREAGDG